ncbi:MAG: hypothetical protein ACOCQ4_03085 [bacterium]
MTKDNDKKARKEAEKKLAKERMQQNSGKNPDDFDINEEKEK